jgi:hypothetical protein
MNDKNLTPVRTSAEGRALVQNRWEKQRRAVIAGAMAGVTSVVDPADIPADYGDTEIISHVVSRIQAEKAVVDGETKAARFLFSAMGIPGFVPAEKSAQSASTINNVMINVSDPQQVSDLRSLLAEVQQARGAIEHSSADIA